MAGLEGSIRPFVGTETDPTRYQQPGTVGVPNVRIAIGMKGGTKTFATSGSMSVGTYMGKVKTENPATSAAIKAAMTAVQQRDYAIQQAGGPDSAGGQAIINPTGG